MKNISRYVLPVILSTGLYLNGCEKRTAEAEAQQTDRFGEYFAMHELRRIPNSVNYNLREPKAIATGDINSDGKTDIIITTDDGRVFVYENNLPTPQKDK